MLAKWKGARFEKNGAFLEEVSTTALQQAVESVVLMWVVIDD